MQGLVSKLMYSGELEARWDGPSGTVVLHHAPPSKLQALALEFADRVSALAEFNERQLGARTGVDRFGGE